jgi:hypothetical protein
MEGMGVRTEEKIDRVMRKLRELEEEDPSWKQKEKRKQGELLQTEAALERMQKL